MARRHHSGPNKPRAAANPAGNTSIRTGSAAAARRAGARANRERTDKGPDLPRWVAPVLFLVATVALFPEVFFKGNTLFGNDTLGLSYLARNFYTEFVRAKHAFPLWDPMVLGGLPFLEGMHGDIFYPPSLAMFFLDAKTMWAWKMVLHIFLAGMFAYVWLRRGMKLRRGPALFGGLVYMMGADLVSLVAPGGDGKLFVSALAPLVFWLAERAASGRRLPDFAAFALGITLIILTSHMQLAYFCVWGVTAYFMFRVWEIWLADRNGREAARLVGLFALAGLLGVGAAAIQFAPPLGYLRTASLRVGQRSDPKQAYVEATSYSLHPEEVVSLAVPEFVGATDNGVKDGARLPPTYWGQNPFKLNHEYAGVIALLLLPVMFLRRRKRVAWFFAGLATFSLLFAVGATTPLFHLFMLIPGVKLFRAPSLIIFLYALSISTIAAMSVERLLAWQGSDAEDERAVTRYMWTALGITGFLALMASSGILMTFWRGAVYDPAAADEFKAAALTANVGAIQLGFWILFVLTALVTAWWAGVRTGKIGARTAIFAIALLAALDLYRVDRPFVHNTAFMNEQLKQMPYFESDTIMKFLKKESADPKHVFRVATYMDPSSGRMAYRISRNTLAIHGFEQVAGLHGNEIGRYAALVGPDASDAFGNLQLLNLLNTEYVVFPSRIKPIEPLEEVVVGTEGALYRNKAAWPRAILVGHTQILPDSLAFEAMRTGAIDLKKNAIVDSAIADLPISIADPQGSVEWIEHGVNRLRLRVTSDQPALLVVSDNYYPAWKATVGGKATPVHRVDYTFRGVVVPAGTNDVEMYYSTDHLRVAAMTSIVLMVLLLGVFLSGFVRPAAPLSVASDPDAA